MTTTRTKRTSPSTRKAPTRTAAPTEGWYVIECWDSKVDADCGMPALEVHVVPGFGREHVIKDLLCWCHPKRDDECSNMVVHEVAQ